jgi:hypothetical protein
MFINATIEIALMWPAAKHYELVVPDVDADLRRMAQAGLVNDVPPQWLLCIRRIDQGQVRRARVLDANPNLFRQFAGLPYATSAYEDFAKRFGSLVTNEDQPLRMVGWAAFHSSVRELIGLSIVEEPSFVRGWRIAERNIMFLTRGTEPDARGHVNSFTETGLFDVGSVFSAPEPVVTYIAHDLRAGIAIQALRSVQKLPRSVGMMKCANCGLSFEVGTGTGRRSTSKFCSPKCQQTFRYRYRVKESGK